MNPLSRFRKLCEKTVSCNYCFESSSLKLTRTTIDLPQPRWIGHDYWKAKKRILVLMLNPGAGKARQDNVDDVARQNLRLFKNGKNNLNEILETQGKDMEGWGKGKFLPFYESMTGLERSFLAFANVAWCSTKGNKYPSQMLEHCFENHTEALLHILSPNVVLISGSSAHRFAQQIQNNLPKIKVICTFHFAHREGRNTQAEEIRKVKQCL